MEVSRIFVFKICSFRNTPKSRKKSINGKSFFRALLPGSTARINTPRRRGRPLSERIGIIVLVIFLFNLEIFQHSQSNPANPCRRAMTASFLILHVRHYTGKPLVRHGIFVKKWQYQDYPRVIYLFNYIYGDIVAHCLPLSWAFVKIGH